MAEGHESRLALIITIIHTATTILSSESLWLRDVMMTRRKFANALVQIYTRPSHGQSCRRCSSAIYRRVPQHRIIHFRSYKIVHARAHGWSVLHNDTHTYIGAASNVHSGPSLQSSCQRHVSDIRERTAFRFLSRLTGKASSSTRTASTQKYPPQASPSTSFASGTFCVPDFSSPSCSISNPSSLIARSCSSLNSSKFSVIFGPVNLCKHQFCSIASHSTGLTISSHR